MCYKETRVKKKIEVCKKKNPQKTKQKANLKYILNDTIDKNEKSELHITLISGTSPCSNG